jgi:hypothetical protein
MTGRRRLGALGRGGAALLTSFMLMLMLSTMALAVGVTSHNSLTGARSQLADKQAFWVAEAGWQRARQALLAGTWTAAGSPGNTYTEDFPPSPATKTGEYRVTIVNNGSDYTITSEGYVPSLSASVARRQVIEDEASVTFNDGTNYSLTATASASSTNGSNVPANARDGSTSTFWRAQNNGNGWLMMDHGSAVTLNKIVVQENNNITGVSIEWSDDNSAWTTAAGLSVVESPSRTWTATFTPASHRYFRASVSASSSNRPSVEEMRNYNSSFGALGTGEVTTQW